MSGCSNHSLTQAQAVAEKWGKQIKLERAPKDCPTHPFPLVLQRTIPQPETAAQWDVDKLVVRLRLGNKDPNELDVKVTEPSAHWSCVY